MLTKLRWCHFLLFAHDCIPSKLGGAPRMGGVGWGQVLQPRGPPPPERRGNEQGGAHREGWLPGGLTFWRSVCSCFSITSSWYTLPVRSRGGSSLETQGAG